jgi:hypothetical protein
VAARERRPERWSGTTRNWSPVELAVLNPAPVAAEMATTQ